MDDIFELLAPLTGRWVTSITLLYPLAERGTVYRAVDTYRWLAGGKVLVHEVEAFMGTPVVSVEVYSQGPDGKIGSRNFGGDGQVSDYEASMTAGVWTVTGTSERFRSTLVSKDQIEGLWKRRTDAGWIDWMTVKLQRVS